MSDGDAALVYSEIFQQPYKDCAFSCGFVGGHPVDTMYLKWERPNEGPITILMRPDEIAVVGFLCNSLLWNHFLPSQREVVHGEKPSE